MADSLSHLQPLNTRKLSDQIVAQLETLLLEGSFLMIMRNYMRLKMV